MTQLILDLTSDELDTLIEAVAGVVKAQPFLSNTPALSLLRQINTQAVDRWAIEESCDAGTCRHQDCARDRVAIKRATRDNTSTWRNGDRKDS